MQLHDPKLFKTQALINGRWCHAESGATFTVHNPATGNLLAQVPNMNETDCQNAIDAAQQALPAWQQRSANERSAILRRWFDLIMAHQQDLATILTLEGGKPLVEACGEIAYGASYVAWYAEEAKRLYGQTIPAPQSDQQIIISRQAIGVCAAITPWNFPNAMITRKVAPALAAGCSFILRPASAVPLSALALAELAQRAGVPDGIFNVITGSADAIGRCLTSSDTIRKFSFTGSTAIGKKLYAQCADTVKKISLELGGNAPFIVFDDADIDAAVAGAMQSKFRHAGQTCICANRFYVQRSIYDAFINRFNTQINALKIGNGLNDDVDIGPLINQAAIDHLQSLIADATAKGAEIVTGGQPASLGGNFFEPTLIKNANASMRFAQEEIFGPIAVVFPFDDEAEVIHHANHTEYGLAAYLYSRDLARIMRLSRALDYGMVAINSGMLSNAAAPFGGIKHSGIGREGGQEGILEYTATKYLLINA